MTRSAPAMPDLDRAAERAPRHSAGASSLGGDFGEHISNPNAPDTIRHALSTAVLEIGAHAKGKELLDDGSLRTDCGCRARSTTPGVLHGEVKRCGPGFVLQRRVTAGSEKIPHGSSAPRS